MFIIHKKFAKGFSAIEIIIVIAIISILFGFAIFSFKNAGERQFLDKTVLLVVSILNEAKSLAISSKNFSDYGVRIENDKIVFFEGVYGNNNKDYPFSSLVGVSLSPGFNNDIIFKNVNGSANASGTISLFLKSNPLEYSEVNVSYTGIIDKVK